MTETVSPSPRAEVVKPQKQFGGYWSLVVVPIVLGIYFMSQILAISLLLPFIRGGDLKQLDNSTILQFSFIALVEALTLSMLYFAMKAGKVRARDIGLGRGPNPSDVGYGVVTFGLYFLCLALIMTLVQTFIPSINVEQQQQIGFKAAAGQSLILVFISLAILPPFVEEIMVRGFLYSGLASKMPKIIAAIGASLLFGVAHLELGSGMPPLWIAAIDTFLLSIVLIALREQTKSLWAGIFVHAIKNGLAFVALFLLHTN